ncbi:hypothetical protein LJR074_003767 [Acidovorax sp. LjRoot74]
MHALRPAVYLAQEVGKGVG